MMSLVDELHNLLLILPFYFPFPDQVMKVDTLTGDVTTWKEPGHFVSEPVFIPRPGKNVVSLRLKPEI